MAEDSKKKVNILTDTEEAKDTQDFINSVVRRLAHMTYIRPEEIPNIDLYMDQVTTFMDEHLSDSKRYTDDKILTKTMINNYAKNDLLPPPVKKKYSKEHMIMLIFIYYFKNILSISDIQSLLTPLTENFFQKEDALSLERIYKEVYNYERRQMSDIAKDICQEQRDSLGLFKDVEDENQRKYLQLFSLISMLSFDIYAKKYVIENVIDELNALNEKIASKDTSDKKKSNKKSDKK